MSNKVLQRIFSITNEKTNKIITILGIKIKIKSLILENRYLKEKNKYYLEAIKSNPEMFEIYIKNPELQKQDKKRTPIVREKIERLLNSNPYPLFYLVEIETINRCNGECAFCPVNRFDDPREFKLMDESLFYNIIQQLKELNYKGRIQIFSNNEPLMDKRIYDFSDYVRKELSDCHSVIFTNGILLTLEKFKRLIPNYDTFCIDIYYSGEQKIPDNIKPIIDLCLKDKKLQKKVKVQFIDKEAIRNNRGGNSKNRKNIYHLDCPCLTPFVQVVIRPDGKLSLCCNDATAEFTMGDLTKEKLIDIWEGKYYQEVRDKLKYDRVQISKCYNCDSFGSSYGVNSSKDYVFTQKQIVKAWEKVRAIGAENDAK